MTNYCTRCSRQCGDAYACSECAKTAALNLGHIADLAAAFDEKRAKIRSSWDVSNLGASRPAKQWRTSSGEHTTFAASPTFTPGTALGFDPRVSRVEFRVRTMLSRVMPTGGTTDLPDNAESHTIARWLSRHVKDIRHQPHAGEAFDLIDRMLSDLHDLFDNPPPALFLGECKAEFEDGECTESLYLDREKITSDTVACPRCGITHDVAERRATLLAGVDDYLGTVKEISRLLRNLAGSAVSERMIHGYAAHGMLTKMGTRREYDKTGRPRDVALYRIGQVRDAAQAVQSRREARRTQRTIEQGTGQRVG